MTDAPVLYTLTIDYPERPHTFMSIDNGPYAFGNLVDNAIRSGYSYHYGTRPALTKADAKREMRRYRRLCMAEWKAYRAWKDHKRYADVETEAERAAYHDWAEKLRAAEDAREPIYQACVAGNADLTELHRISEDVRAQLGIRG